MAATIFALFIVWVVAEITVFVAVASAIGCLNAFGLVLLFSIIGVWLTKRAGISVLTRSRKQLNEGVVPTDDVIDGFLVCIAGLMLVVPGFITDALGLVVLFPPTRAFVRKRVRNRWQVRVVNYGAQRVYGTQRVAGPLHVTNEADEPQDAIIDVDSHERRKPGPQHPNSIDPGPWDAHAEGS
jgi:UPF0716 protein FxsA